MQRSLGRVCSSCACVQLLCIGAFPTPTNDSDARQVQGLICFDLSTVGTCFRSTSLRFSIKNNLLLSLWVCGREARECGQPVGRANNAFDVATAARRGPWVVHTSLLGPVRRDADSSTYPRAGAGIDANTLAQGTQGRLRRWIMLRCVDWLPTGLHCVAELAFLYDQGSAPGMPAGDCPERCRYSVNKGSPHNVSVSLSCPARSIRQYVLVGHCLSPAAAPGAASHGVRCPR